MRLSDRQRRITVTGVVQTLGLSAAVWLLGSRAGDARRRGHNNWLIGTDNPDSKVSTRAEIALSTRLYRHLVDLTIDILREYPNRFRRALIVDIAQREGIRR